MLSLTRRLLQDFDNDHDFERMAADVLNGLGYTHVEPMAPGGGRDGGQDIKFRRDGISGIALVTLNKAIEKKFTNDLAKQQNGDGIIALFCKVSVSPAMKRTFTNKAIVKGYELEVYDLERLRSLLDSALKDVRRRYLHIDDEVVSRLRQEVTTLLCFPAASVNTTAPTILEQLLVNKLPCKLFELLVGYDAQVVSEVPDIGLLLHEHLTKYHDFRTALTKFEADLLQYIGKTVAVRFRDGWKIYLKYVLMRFAGKPQEKIIAEGDFLNYDITWNDAERVFEELSDNVSVSSRAGEIFAIHQDMSKVLLQLKP